MRLENKTAIITGGASGIGNAVAKRFEAEGATVHVFDLNSGNVDGNIIFHQVDASDQKACVNAAAEVATKAGIDILVNCAGISHIGKLDTTSTDDFERLFNVNVKGVYNSMFACISHMMDGNGGVILNLASIASHVGIPDRFAYSMTKGAVLTMTYSVACDYLKNNIRCNCISPARIHTPFVDDFIAKTYPGQEKEMFEKLSQSQPIGRMGTPSEVANLALYLCSDESGFITGTDFPIDGGFIKIKS
ncbi:MAG: SDR family oxidoreductase [Flavobacteriales bacterium]|nr:SDR family oxidoreductase [Flavobacteriales bacterium]